MCFCCFCSCSDSAGKTFPATPTAVAAAEPVDPAALLREVEQGHRRYRTLKERLGASRHGLYVAFSQLRKQGLVTGWDNSMHGELRLAEPK